MTNIIPFHSPSLTTADKVRCWEIGPYKSYDFVVVRDDHEALKTAQKLMEEKWDDSANIWDTSVPLQDREFSVFMREAWYTEEELSEFEKGEE